MTRVGRLLLFFYPLEVRATIWPEWLLPQSKSASGDGVTRCLYMSVNVTLTERSGEANSLNNTTRNILATTQKCVSCF